AVRSPQTFVQAMARVEFAFNWFYADDEHVAFFSSGRLPVRAPGTDPALPTAEHPQAIDPPSGVIVNWNNKPAADVGAADSNFSYGSVQRVDLLVEKLARRRRHTLATVVAGMNEAATQDLRAARVWPLVRAVLDSGQAAAATAQAREAASLVDQWAAEGASRLDANGDG